MEQLEAAQAEQVEAVKNELAQGKARAAADRAELEDAARRLTELDMQRSEWESTAAERTAILTEKQMQHLQSITEEAEQQRARMEEQVIILEKDEVQVAAQLQQTQLYLQEEQEAQTAERGRLDNQKRSL